MKYIVCGGGWDFINSSFQDIKKLNIDWFIAVNFTHTIPDNEMIINLKELVKDNQVRYIVLDEVTGNYQYSHNYVELIPEEYTLKDTIGPFLSDGGEIYIKVFKKVMRGK